MNLLRIHQALERNSALLVFGILVVSSIGGLVQVLPSIVDESLAAPAANVVPHPPLELVGRDVYIRESCSTCHSQQVRPLLAEVKRYGQYAGAGEFAYERPFLWGSKRTGPDLLRVGGKYTDAWHRIHMTDPRTVVSSSIMPAYPWLAERAAERRHGGRASQRVTDARPPVLRPRHRRRAGRARRQDGARRGRRLSTVARQIRERGAGRARRT